MGNLDQWLADTNCWNADLLADSADTNHCVASPDPISNSGWVTGQN